MDLTQVNGVKVIARQKARCTPQNAPSPQAIGKEIKTVDELLLEDETIVFHCVHPNASDCVYVAGTAHSVTAHQRMHSDAALRKKADAKLAALESRQAKIFANRSNGARKGAQTKRIKRTQAPLEIGRGGSGERSTVFPTGDTELARQARHVVAAYNAMVTAQTEFDRLFVGYMRAAQTATERTAMNPLIIDKAKKWDEMQALFGK